MLQAPAVSAYSQRQIIEKTRFASERARFLLDEVARILVPGITEGEACRQALAVMQAHGAEKSWHRPYIYFGEHSILTFQDKPAEERTLQTEDIAYIDIGPVIRTPEDGLEVEGDVGQTYVFGQNPLFHALKAECARINERARRYWREQQPTGVELYEAMRRWTHEAGWMFHLEPAGHLIGSFPHTGWKEGLSAYPYCPEPGLWILEVQIRHPEKPYGAFFEDVLI